MRKWNDTLWLFTIDEYNQLPDGIELKCIDGLYYVKGRDEIDDDTRGGYMAFGIENPNEHELAETFSFFRLAS